MSKSVVFVRGDPYARETHTIFVCPSKGCSVQIVLVNGVGCADSWEAGIHRHLSSHLTRAELESIVEHRSR